MVNLSGHFLFALALNFQFRRLIIVFGGSAVYHVNDPIRFVILENK